MGSTAFAATADTISANWSGYVADTVASYSSVGATWAVPAPSPAENPLATDATWVGVGGVKTNDLIQAGTQAVIENGQVAYQAWYELLPQGQVILPIAIGGGDSVTVSLTQTGQGIWHLSFIDDTTGKEYGTDIAYNSSESSAEWVEERPVVEAGRMISYLPLDNFGIVNFTGGYTVADGTRESIAGAGATSMNMASRGTELGNLPLPYPATHSPSPDPLRMHPRLLSNLPHSPSRM